MLFMGNVRTANSVFSTSFYLTLCLADGMAGRSCESIIEDGLEFIY
jgi:hypothetical protein